MDKYQMVEIVGEGSYGVVMKCKHKETGQLVAIKRFLETGEGHHHHRLRKLAFREIRMLKKLHHGNLVNMIEVFRRRKRFYLVFEYMDHTLLDELENVGGHGLGWETSRKHVFQVLRGLRFCHASNIIHRDIKPENVLVSPKGVIKLCDFGFARLVNSANESCTDYVATRWYRAPELLVGDPRYGKPADVWAVGCLYAEMVVGDPLFPGDSDIDQLYRITKLLGGLCAKHQAMLSGGDRPGRMLLIGPTRSAVQSIRNIFPTWDYLMVDFLARCFRMDPDVRPSCSTLLYHPFFTQHCFDEKFLLELNGRIAEEIALNPLLWKKVKRWTLNTCIGLIEMPCENDATRWCVLPVLRDGKSTVSMRVDSTDTKLKESVHHYSSRKNNQVNNICTVPNTMYIRATTGAACLSY